MLKGVKNDRVHGELTCVLGSIGSWHYITWKLEWYIDADGIPHIVYIGNSVWEAVIDFY